MVPDQIIASRMQVYKQSLPKISQNSEEKQMMGTENENFKKMVQSCRTLTQLLHRVDDMYTTKPKHCITTDVDASFLCQLEELSSLPHARVLVHGMSEVRVVVLDQADREHNMLVARIAPDKFSIREMSVPFDTHQQQTYPSLTSAVETFQSVISSLQEYFRELEQIDNNCWVVDPVVPNFKDDYRRIVLEDRVWLHIEVSAESSGSQLRVLGPSEPAKRWNERLASRLHLWSPDASVLDNITNVLDIEELPQAPAAADTVTSQQEEFTCAICLCCQLGDQFGLPLPLCANTKCGSYMHPTCLFQWLVASSGGVVPKLKVVVGKCPCCLAPISCSETDT